VTRRAQALGLGFLIGALLALAEGYAIIRSSELGFVSPTRELLAMELRYGAALDPATFHATLDGERVTAAFHPEPGSAETVALAFIGGRNHLVLEASSSDGLSHITLERWIGFARFPGDENADVRVHSAPELKHELWKKTTPEAPAPAPAAAPATKP